MLNSVCNFIDTFLGCLGGLGKIKIKDHLSPTESENGTELGNKSRNPMILFSGRVNYDFSIKLLDWTLSHTKMMSAICSQGISSK